MNEDIKFLLDTLLMHKESHQSWVNHMRENPGCECIIKNSDTVVSLQYQEEIVKRYDRLINIVNQLQQKMAYA